MANIIKEFSTRHKDWRRNDGTVVRGCNQEIIVVTYDEINVKSGKNRVEQLNKNRTPHYKTCPARESNNDSGYSSSGTTTTTQLTGLSNQSTADVVGHQIADIIKRVEELETRVDALEVKMSLVNIPKQDAGKDVEKEYKEAGML